MKFKKMMIGAVLLSGLTVLSQQANAQVDVGVRAGFNLSNVTMSSDDPDFEDDYDGKTLNPGFHVGVTFDIPVADEFYVQPGALFSTKGYKIKDESDFGKFSFTATPFYLEVPVNFLYAPALGTGRLLLGAGPYAAYGLGGRWREKQTDGESDNYDDKGSLEFIKDWDDQSDDEDTYAYGKPFDFGANLLAGYEFANRLSVQLNAQLGLANIAPELGGEIVDNDKIKNVGFGLSLGYKF
ncbi:hypothetical protein GCM10027051_07240 [Niabella terrae]